MSPIAITLFIFTLQINQVLGPAEFLGQFNDCAPTDRKPLLRILHPFPSCLSLGHKSEGYLNFRLQFFTLFLSLINFI